MKSINRSIIPLLAGTISLSAFANTDDTEAAIKANLLSWTYAFNSGNAAALSELYTEDAVIMPPTDVTIITKAAIQQYWNEELSENLKDLSIDQVKLTIEGNTAYQASIWSATQAGSNRSIGGNVLTVLERQPDGRWKTRLHSWN